MNQFPAVDKSDRIIGFVVRDPQNKFLAWSYFPLEKTHPLIADANLAEIKSQCQCIRRSDYQGTAFFSAITSMIVALCSNSTGISLDVCYDTQSLDSMSAVSSATYRTERGKTNTTRCASSSW